jgi:hypothetical protein
MKLLSREVEGQSLRNLGNQPPGMVPIPAEIIFWKIRETIY